MFCIELNIGTLVNSTVPMNRLVFYIIPYITRGITIRIEALAGGIHCYASDTNQYPSTSNHRWTLFTQDYDDLYLFGGRSAAIYISLLGAYTVNNFTINTTIGDTSIQGIIFK